MINVEDHAAHCEMAREIITIIIVQVEQKRQCSNQWYCTAENLGGRGGSAH